MWTTPTKTLHKWLGWTMVSVLVISVLVWYGARERLPATIRIATAEPGGQYFRFGKALEAAQVARSGRPVDVCLTKGSVENRQRLLSEEAQQRVDVAIIQNGAVPMDGLTVVAPLHYDVVHVVVRRDRGIHSILDLEGKTVVLGPTGSGMRRSAENVLDHYGLTDRVVDRSSAYFHDMLEDTSLDAAIVTTGVANADLKEVLHSEDFELLPLDAEALAMKYAYFECFDIPRGLYAEGPPAPATDVRTVAATAYLVVREGASDMLVTELLESLYSEEVRTEFPHLISHRDAEDVLPVRLHPVSERFFDPFDSLGLLAAVMESLAATKELIFAFGAGMYLLWDRLRRLRERERQQEIKAQKEHLDTFLERTLKVEHAQMTTVDPRELRQFLDEVTRIKLQALRELTNEDLRADQMFSLFLMQCANLISKIQMKLITRESSASSGDLHTK